MTDEKHATPPTKAGRRRTAGSGPGGFLRRLPVVLLLAACGMQLLPQGEAPLNGGQVVRLERTTPRLEVPRGAVVTAADGREAIVIERNATAAGGEELVLEHLEPGTYHVTWPGSGYGGAHLPDRATLVLVDPIDGANPGALQRIIGAAPVLLAVALLLLTAFIAGRAPRGGRQHRAASALLVVGLAGWGASGWTAPSVNSLLSMLLAVVAGVLVLVRPVTPLSPLLAVSGVGVLLWTTPAIGALHALLVLGPALLSGPICRRAWEPSPRFGVVVVASLLALIGIVSVGGTPLNRIVGGPGHVGSGNVELAECVQRHLADVETGRDCFRAYGARLGADSPTGAASQELLAALESVSKDVNPSAVCRQAGLALSYGAARWGEDRDDPRSLFVDLGAICDYSSMHGIVAGAFAHLPDDEFQRRVLELCTVESPDESLLSSPEYAMQCWQGVGIAIGRRGGYADPGVFELCRQAPRYGITNCTDGYFQEFIDQKARAMADPGRRLYPEGTRVFSLCRDLEQVLAHGCYRYIGEEAYYDGLTRSEGADELERVCTTESPGAHGTSCWYALGMVKVRSYLQASFEELEGPALAICAKAPNLDAVAECLHGAGNAIIGMFNGRIEIERICEWFPEADRERYCELTRIYVEHVLPADAK